MKFELKETTKVPVGKRMEDSYRYESEDGKVIVQFNAGKRAWTFEIGLATNAPGQAIASKLIDQWCKAGIDASSAGKDLNQATKILEVS